MLLFLKTIMDLTEETQVDKEMMRPRLSTIMLLFLQTIMDLTQEARDDKGDDEAEAVHNHASFPAQNHGFDRRNP
jgi:hypothetical protein